MQALFSDISGGSASPTPELVPRAQQHHAAVHGALSVLQHLIRMCGTLVVHTPQHDAISGGGGDQQRRRPARAFTPMIEEVDEAPVISEPTAAELRQAAAADMVCAAIQTCALYAEGGSPACPWSDANCAAATSAALQALVSRVRAQPPSSRVLEREHSGLLRTLAAEEVALGDLLAAMCPRALQHIRSRLLQGRSTDGAIDSSSIGSKGTDTFERLLEAQQLAWLCGRVQRPFTSVLVGHLLPSTMVRTAAGIAWQGTSLFNQSIFML